MKSIGIDISGDVADMLGWNQKDEGTLNKIQQKWVKNFETSLKERQTKIYKLSFDDKDKIQNKKYATQATAKEQITKYNQLLTQLKSKDSIVSGQANDGIQQLIDKLKDSNSQLSDYISNARDAVKGEDGSDDVEKLNALNDEDFMASQRESIKEILSNGNVRQVIEEYSALATETGEVSDEQRVMLSAIRGTDDELARFLEQNPTATMGQYRRSLIATTAKTMALELATTALNAAISFGIGAAISAAIAGITALINHYSNLREKNEEAAEQFKQTSDAIQEQTNKIKELQKVVENEKSTSGELYDARSDLLDIQREIIDTYGKQAEGIDLVNGKLDEEIEKLDEVEMKQAAEAFHKMSQESYEHDKRSLEKKHNGSGPSDNYSVGIAVDAFDNEQFEKQALELEKKILSLGYQSAGDTASSRTYSLTDVTDEEAIAKINELMAYIESNISTSSDLYNLRDNLSKKLENLDTEDYRAKKSNIETYALQNILSTEKYRTVYKGLQAAAADYDEAIKTGDKILEKSSMERIDELKNKIEGLSIDDEYIKEQFDTALTQIQKDLNKHELKVYIETAPKYSYSPVFGVSENGARGGYSPMEYFKNAFEGYNDLDVKKIGISGGSGEEVKAYDMLQKAADHYEMSVEDVIAILVDLGIVFSRDADAAKYTTTNFSSMLEEVEKTTEGVDKFVSAQDKLASGTSLTADEVNELIKLDGDLANSVERTADGYTISSEKLAESRAKYVESQRDSLKEDIKASERQLANIQLELNTNQKIVDELKGKENLTDAEKRKLNEAQTIVENRLEDEKATTTQLEQQKFLLEQIISPVEDYAEKFGQVADKAKSITDRITQMRANQKKTGTVNPADAFDFINEVPDWKNYIEINDGKVTVKNTSSEALKEQIKETSGYNTTVADLNQRLKERDELQKKINDFKAKPINSASDVKMLDDMNWELGLLNETIDISEDELNSLTEVLDVLFNKLEKAPAITNFEEDLAKLNHNKSLGMSEDAFASAYANLAGQYRSDLQALADTGDTDALSKLWEIDEQLYQNNLDAEQRAFDEQKLLIDNAREDLTTSILEYQKQYSELNETYYAPGTALGNTEDGKKQYKSNLREIAKLSSDAYNDIISRIQSSIDFGEIIDPDIIDDIKEVFEGQELPDAVADVISKGIETGVWNATDMAQIAPYLTEALLAGNDQLTEAYRSAKEDQKDKIISAYEYETQQIEQKLEDGVITSQQAIDEMTAAWEKYYKDKTEFAEEDRQAQKSILEAHKNEIQKQIDALEDYSDAQTEPYQNEIDALNDVKDAYDDMMDDRIDALEEEKKALEKKNKEQEESNDLQGKWNNLQKASMNKRLVYTGNGSWELRRDEEEYKSAKKEYDEAKKEDVNSKLDEAIDKLQEEKDARDKAIDKDIKSREDAIAKIEKPIDNLTKVLTALVAEQHNIDPQFIAQLLASESGETAITALNKAMGFGQQQELKYGTDANNDLLTNETAQNIAKDAEKRNKTTGEAAKSIGLDLGGNASANKTEQKAENPIISDLINQWNDLQSELAKIPENYGEDGHKGNVDYNHRTTVLHDTEGNYGTIYGTTLTYSDMAEIFEQYLTEQEEQGKIISESIWDISEALWKKADELPDGAFNMTPFKPNGETIVDLNSDHFEDEMYDYVISQLAQGIHLEDMDTFMGGDYATVNEADKAAQQMHEDNASLYDQGKNILLQLVLLGYDINKLQGAAYDGTPVDAETANKNLTDALKENTAATKDNSSATEKNSSTTENNNTATKANTEVTKSASATTAANTTAVTDGAVEVGKYALKGNESDGTITKDPILDSKGNFVSNKSVKALSHSDWAKKHKVSEWAPDGKHVNENMTMEQYEQLKKAQKAKNSIIPASIVDIADITDEQLKQFLSAIQSDTKISPQNIATAELKTVDTSASDINSNVTNSPVINFTVQVEGSADEKTVQAMKNEIGNALISYTDKLISAIPVSSMRRQNKS